MATTEVETKCSHTRLADIADLVENPRNPNGHPDSQIELLAKIIASQGWRSPIVVSKRSGFIVKGHGRYQAALKLGLDQVPIDEQEYESEAKEWADMIADNRLAELADIDRSDLKDLLSDLDTGDFDMDLTGFLEDDLSSLMSEFEEESEGLTDEDAVPEVPEEPTAKLGQIWKLGKHRLMCGDSTDKEQVAKLMDGEKAELLHADPPYGMGKEGDGVANDNLYRDQLDAFQMDWWVAFRPHTEDNGSAYIWGNADSLWRLWYTGGLSVSERMTLKNEIIWKKAGGFGISSEKMRSYPPQTERCLFFVLGEQGYNNNADNYWEGWEPVRKYLKTERDKMGWNNKTVADFFGFDARMADFWFSRSQWSFPRREQYERMKSEAKGQAFKREHDELKRDHDELKREFHATRAYFDNTHDNMSDVWEFGRVTGEERHGHATPKPVEMMERVMKSSLPNGGLCVEPFGGSGSTLIGAEKTGRRCYTMELQPVYCDVIIQRWEEFTGEQAELVE